MVLKKALAAACILGVMTASLTACGSDNDNNSDKGTTSEATTKATENGGVVTTVKDMIDDAVTTVSSVLGDMT